MFLGFCTFPNVKIHILCEKVGRNPLDMFSVPVLHFQKSISFRESDKQSDRQNGVPKLKYLWPQTPEYREKVVKFFK